MWLWPCVCLGFHFLMCKIRKYITPPFSPGLLLIIRWVSFHSSFCLGSLLLPPRWGWVPSLCVLHQSPYGILLKLSINFSPSLFRAWASQGQRPRFCTTSVLLRVGGRKKKVIKDISWVHIKSLNLISLAPTLILCITLAKLVNLHRSLCPPVEWWQ